MVEYDAVLYESIEGCFLSYWRREFGFTVL
jgi:hypothetical protein